MLFRSVELPINILDFLAVKTNILPSKGEARKMVSGGGVSINKEKVSDITANIDESHILDEKYILVQKGKKNYFLIHVK